MTEASIETLEVSVEAPARRRSSVSLARPAPQGQATMLEGDAEARPRRSSRCCANAGALVG